MDGTVFAVTYAFSAPFFGWLSDKKGRRTIITFGLLFFAISNALTAFASSFLWLIVIRILAGLSVASITPLIYAIIGDIAPPNRRGKWLSIVVSGHLTALWAGAPFGTLLEHFLGWRPVFVVMAIIGAILAAVNFKTWKSIPKSDLTRSRLIRRESSKNTWFRKCYYHLGDFYVCPLCLFRCSALLRK